MQLKFYVAQCLSNLHQFAIANNKSVVWISRSLKSYCYSLYFLNLFSHLLPRKTANRKAFVLRLFRQFSRGLLFKAVFYSFILSNKKAYLHISLVYLRTPSRKNFFNFSFLKSTSKHFIRMNILNFSFD